MGIVASFVLADEKNLWIQNSKIKRKIGPFILGIMAKEGNTWLSELKDDLVTSFLRQIGESGKVEFERMEWIISKSVGRMGDDFHQPECELYILRYTNCFCGSLIILNKKVLTSIYNLIGDFYIVPNTINEVFIIRVEETLWKDMDESEINSISRKIEKREIGSDEWMGGQAIKYSEWIKSLSENFI